MSRVEIAGEVLDELETHSFSNVQQEVGGILYGNLGQQPIAVRGSLPALKATADQTSVTFTHEVWDAVHAEMDARHPDEQIVGWYHTHPGFGLFLSEYDMFIHRNFFSDPRMVALVIDPLAAELGWFGWRDEQVELLRTEPTRREAARRPSAAPPQEQRGLKTSAVVPVAALAALAVGVGGYWLGATTDPDEESVAAAPRPAVPDPAIRAAENRVSALEARNGRLLRQLRRAQDQRPRTLSYTVRTGDTLSDIANFVYGDPAAVTRIVAINEGLNADELAVGQVLSIPLPTRLGG